MEMRKRERLHKIVYAVARQYFKISLRRYCKKVDIAPHMDEPFIIMSNHLTTFDTQFISQSFPQHTYFVCGEHILRGKNGKAIRYLYDPITTYMGGNKLAATIEMLRRIRNGNNILIYPEGARTYDGVTSAINENTAKLVKKAKCALITYRMTGGYFADPRWAHHRRTGPITGKIVNIYSSQQIAAMTLEELTDCINSDIYENAYDMQSIEPVAYPGEGLAEGLENYLIICPKCGGYETLETKDNKFVCRDCGLEGTYDEYGFLIGDKLPFDRIDKWNQWLIPKFESDMSKRSSDELLFTDENVNLQKVFSGYRTEDMGSDTVRLYTDRMYFGDEEFRFADMSSMSLLFTGITALFTHKGQFYSLGRNRFLARKLDMMYKLYKKNTNVSV